MKPNRKTLYNAGVLFGAAIVLTLGLYLELPLALGDAINFWTWWIVIPVALGVIGRFLLSGSVGLRVAVLPLIPAITILVLIRISSLNNSGGEEIAWLILFGVVWVVLATIVLVVLEAVRKWL